MSDGLKAFTATLYTLGSLFAGNIHSTSSAPPIALHNTWLVRNDGADKLLLVTGCTVAVATATYVLRLSSTLQTMVTP